MAKADFDARHTVMLVSGETNLLDTGHAYDADAAFHKPLDISAFLAKIREISRG
jgi:hypothetical protein